MKQWEDTHKVYVVVEKEEVETNEYQQLDIQQPVQLHESSKISYRPMALFPSKDVKLQEEPKGHVSISLIETDPLNTTKLKFLHILDRAGSFFTMAIGGSYISPLGAGCPSLQHIILAPCGPHLCAVYIDKPFNRLC